MSIPVSYDRGDLAYALLNVIIAEILSERPVWDSDELDKRAGNYFAARDALVTHNVRPALIEELIFEAKKELMRRWSDENE